MCQKSLTFFFFSCKTGVPLSFPGQTSLVLNLLDFETNYLFLWPAIWKGGACRSYAKQCFILQGSQTNHLVQGRDLVTFYLRSHFLARPLLKCLKIEGSRDYGSDSHWYRKPRTTSLTFTSVVLALDSTSL